MEVIEILEKDYELARFLKALGNPVRLSIIRKLLEKSNCPHGCDPCSCGDGCVGKECKCGCKCGELVEMFSISQSTVSQHLKELKNAGLIDIVNRKGDYILNHHKINKGLKLLLKMMEKGGNEDFNDNENTDTLCNCNKISKTYKPN